MHTLRRRVVVTRKEVPTCPSFLSRCGDREAVEALKALERSFTVFGPSQKQGTPDLPYNVRMDTFARTLKGKLPAVEPPESPFDERMKGFASAVKGKVKPS